MKMPYWNYENSRYDKKGVLVSHGDVLVNHDLPDTSGEKYLVCRRKGDFLEVRDTGNNNTNMCYLSSYPGDGRSNVINMGHWTANIDFLDLDDIAFYFLSQDYPSEEISRDAELLKDKLLR